MNYSVGFLASFKIHADSESRSESNALNRIRIPIAIPIVFFHPLLAVHDPRTKSLPGDAITNRFVSSHCCAVPERESHHCFQLW